MSDYLPITEMTNPLARPVPRDDERVRCRNCQHIKSTDRGWCLRHKRYEIVDNVHNCLQFKAKPGHWRNQ